MFNRKKVEKLEGDLYVARTEIKYHIDEIVELQSLITRASLSLCPGPFALHHSKITLTNYLDKLEKDSSEKTEREKIEKIVLDLKNRKWEPTE